MPPGPSTALANALLDLVLNNTAVPFSLANVYVSLHTASPGDNGANEVAGGSYARLQPDWTAAATKSSENAAQMEYADMPTATVTHFGLWNASSGGTFLWGGELTTPRSPLAGDSIIVSAGDLTAVISG